MKNYLIHIIAKEFSFWIPFFLVEKFVKHTDYFFRTDWWTTKEILGTSLYMAFGFIIINILIFASLRRWINKKRFSSDSFLFGASLHLISLVLISMNVELDGRILNFITGGAISLIISGIVYQKLNIKNKTEDEHATQQTL
ncbi:hypothetical protein [Chondrinema litorale]|uniref:hypothetical protein n=1 Tax=Chondrinema litorale TaxID=2994555 RepID=UPI0025431322|nr:hypothetical protein [Chondrinema litorale]UZR96795.1 hypothetical protein OQ292_24150 [Chondrinema litorale]